MYFISHPSNFQSEDRLDYLEINDVVQTASSGVVLYYGVHLPFYVLPVRRVPVGRCLGRILKINESVLHRKSCRGAILSVCLPPFADDIARKIGRFILWTVREIDLKSIEINPNVSESYWIKS